MKTAKEKAKELVDRFTFADIYFTNGNEGAKLNAKFCAKLCIEEIMGLDFIDDVFLFKSTQTLKEYYQEVKSEIEKL